MKTTRSILGFILALAAALALAACSENNPSEPETQNTGYEPHHFTRDDLQPEGDVVETADGYAVKGALHVNTQEGKRSLVNADLDVKFDEDGRLRSVSGSAQIPSPHERISFEDPVQADVGFFSGRFLNENRDFNILLQDDTDYFVFNFKVTLQMNIATGETGEGATKPLVVKAPLGGQLLMIIDYNDPMYYVYGAQDLIGAAGIGWSYHGRIPFRPWHPVEDLGMFDGKNTRTGTFPVFKILSVTGQMVDNEYTELHLSLEDPFTSDLRMGYQAGYNGEMALDLFMKDIVGIEMPLAEGSGGLWREVSVQDIFQGHAYIKGVSSELDWWPTFIPVKPAHELQVSGFVKSDGDFGIDLHGQYGWELPSGTHAMSGDFQLDPEHMLISGAVQSGEDVMRLTGNVTADATTVSVEPPQSLLDGISARVNGELDDRINEAQEAWEELQDATADYEFELSLRGLRSALPGVCDRARSELSSRISSELKKHEGEIYYGQLKDHIYAKDDAYYAAIARLKAAAQQIQDNDATRREIENALRALAAKKIFKTTFEYKVFGRVVKTVNISQRIMSDTQANQLITAANNVKYIKESWDRKIRAQQIYDNIPDKEIFERVKDDIENGVVIIPDLDEFGFVYGHGGTPTFEIFAIIGGERHELGEVDVFSVPAMTAELASVMVDVLIGG
jgi:hypothetical protein